MGKGTDKLYITHSEWASKDAYSASAGSAVRGKNSDGTANAPFKRLPFNFCAVSLQPFRTPVCTRQGTIFDLEHILAWLDTHPGTHPLDGSSLTAADLIRLHFVKNDDGEYVDPVTYKVITDNTHLIAIATTGNVFAYDTVEQLNIKAKLWQDLVSDEAFSRKDIITLQDPQNIAARNLSDFKYLKDGEKPVQKADPDKQPSINQAAIDGNAARIQKAKAAVAQARAQRAESGAVAANVVRQGKSSNSISSSSVPSKSASSTSSNRPYNAAQHTTGKAAASFTSTGLTPHTALDRALLSEEEYLLQPKRVSQVGYARLQTSHGDLNLELHPRFAPRAVWNFVALAKRGYYSDTVFHRNLRGFMIQGGDPTGTGRGGQSSWGKTFADELDGPLGPDARGVVGLANKGRHTNGSQFFILYRPAPHLLHKHTFFAKVVGGLETLDRLEAEAARSDAEAKAKDKESSDKKSMDKPTLKEVVVFVDPFEEWRREQQEQQAKDAAHNLVEAQGGTVDDRTTWTGKRVRTAQERARNEDPSQSVRGNGLQSRGGNANANANRPSHADSGTGGSGVGKYLRQAQAQVEADPESRDTDEVEEVSASIENGKTHGVDSGRDTGLEGQDFVEPTRKKVKTGGFNFDNW